MNPFHILGIQVRCLFADKNIFNLEAIPHGIVVIVVATKLVEVSECIKFYLGNGFCPATSGAYSFSGAVL